MTAATAPSVAGKWVSVATRRRSVLGAPAGDHRRQPGDRDPPDPRIQRQDHRRRGWHGDEDFRELSRQPTAFRPGRGRSTSPRSTDLPITYRSTISAGGVVLTFTTTFSAWGTAPTVSAPTGAVAWSSLTTATPPGGYGSGGGATSTPDTHRPRPAQPSQGVAPALLHEALGDEVFEDARDRCPMRRESLIAWGSRSGKKRATPAGSSSVSHRMKVCPNSAAFSSVKSAIFAICALLADHPAATCSTGRRIMPRSAMVTIEVWPPGAGGGETLQRRPYPCRSWSPHGLRRFSEADRRDARVGLETHLAVPSRDAEPEPWFAVPVGPRAHTRALPH